MPEGLPVTRFALKMRGVIDWSIETEDVMYKQPQDQRVPGVDAQRLLAATTTAKKTDSKWSWKWWKKDRVVRYFVGKRIRYQDVIVTFEGLSVYCNKVFFTGHIEFEEHLHCPNKDSK